MRFRLSILILALFLVGCGDSTAIKLVKSGKFTNCGKTVEQAISGFFGSPKWESGIGKDGPTKGLTLVNLRGKVKLLGKETDSVLQFIVDEKKGTFEVNALEMNGTPQPPLIIVGLVTKMCQ